MGEVYALGVVVFALRLLKSAFEGISSRKAKRWALAMVLVAFAVILGICLEVSFGVLGWFAGGFDPLYPLEPLIGSFLMLALGSWLYFRKLNGGDSPQKAPSRPWWERCGKGIFALLAIAFFGLFLNGVWFLDPEGGHLPGLIGFCLYMALPFAMMVAYLYLSAEGGSLPKKAVPVFCGVYLALGLLLALWRWIALGLDPLYLAEGGAILLPYDYMNRLAYGTVFLFVINVIVPAGGLLRSCIRPRKRVS
jgi:hypothetical protein